MERLVEAVKFALLIALLYFVYIEAGVATVTLIILLILRIEDMGIGLNLNTDNTESMAYFLSDKHEDFVVEIIGEEDEGEVTKEL